MTVDPGTLALLIVAATAAGFLDAIAGGGGLITLPALLIVGMPPVEAVATNKLQGTFGVAAAGLRYWQAGHLDCAAVGPALAAAGLGAVAGGLAVNAIDEAMLALALPLVLIAVAIYFALAPRPGDLDANPRLSPLAFAAGYAAPIGFYDGVFGPGAGSLYTFGLMALAGLGVLRAVAATKALNFMSNVLSLAVFIVLGKAVFAIGLPMAAGQVGGAWLGAHTAVRNGARLIRPLIVTVSIAIAIKLLIEPAHPIGHWLRSLAQG